MNRMNLGNVGDSFTLMILLRHKYTALYVKADSVEVTYSIFICLLESK